MGDAHVDLRKCDRDRLNRFVKLVAKDPYGMWIAVGDFIDGTTPSHFFFEPATIAPDILEDMGQYVMACLMQCEKIFAPLKDRPGIVLQGNHDIRKGIQWTGFAAELARRLGAQYGGDECLVRVRADTTSETRGASVWTVHAHHGSGGGMYKGGKVNRFLHTSVHRAQADIYCRGHVHDSDCLVLESANVSRKGPAKLVMRKRAWLTAPAFVEQVSEGVHDYASRKCYPLNDTGIIFLELTNAGAKTPSDIRRIEAPF